MKRLLGLAGAVAALVLLVGAPAAYAANTIYVDAANGSDISGCGAQGSPCQTIGFAVDSASSGDTIIVAAGTYGEFPAITKSVTLEGAQAGNPGSAARASESPTTESVVQGMDIDSGGVTVDGFAFDSSGNQITVGASDATIENNVFSGYGNDSGTNDAIGVNAASGTTVTNNYFTSPDIDYGDFGGAVVQWYNGGCSDSSVSDNVFDNADASALADIYFYCDDQTVSTITVSGNQDTIGGDSSFVNFQHIGGSGAEIDVTDNTVTMTPASGSSGIYLSSFESGVQRVNITGNSLTGDPIRAVKLSTNAQLDGPVTITGNDFSDSGMGVYVGSGSIGPDGSVTLRANDLSNERGDTAGDPADGVRNLSGVSVDAIDNWWGCNDGPDASGCSDADPQNGAVTSGPWLELNVSASSSLVATGGSTTVTADLTHDSDSTDTSEQGTVPNGDVVSFATDLGNVSAASAATTNGKASVTVTSSSAGTANVTASSGGPTVSVPVTFATPDATHSALTPVTSALAANGTATELLTVQVKDAAGDSLSGGGATVTITKASGVGSIGSVTDNGDGTYTATVTAPNSVGTGVFVATLNGSPVKSGGSTQMQVTVHFLVLPTITGFTPGSGGVGATVTVTGTHFTGLTHVRLNGTNVAFSVISDTQLTFTVPSGATTGTITVTNGAASATSAGTFTVASHPTITSFTPGIGSVGTSVTITGTNLTGTVGVEIGHIITVPTSVTATQVTFTIPPGAASGTIVILNPAGSASSPTPFTVT